MEPELHDDVLPRVGGECNDPSVVAVQLVQDLAAWLFAR